MPFKRWLDKQSVVYPYNGILFHYKNKWPIKLWKDMKESKMHIAKWKKASLKGDIQYASK